MTDSSTSRLPDRTPKAPISKEHERRNRNDIVGRTKLFLPSLNGLEQLLPSRPLKEQPGVLTTYSRAGITTISALPPTIQQPARIFDPSEHGSEPAQFFSSTTATAISPVSTPIATLPELQHFHQLPSDNKTKSRRWRFFVLSGLLCVLVLFGVFIYGYTHIDTTIQGKRATSLSVQTSHTQQGNNTTPGNNTQQGKNAVQGTKSFQVGEAPSITLQAGTGNVHVHAGGAGTITVGNNNGNNPGSSSSSTSTYTTQARDGQGHDTISITTQPLGQNNNYNLTVPASTHMQIEAASGTITVDGISALTIHTSSGKLDIGNVNGPINVSIANGDITAHNLKGQMTMQTVNGSIRGSMLNGQLKADTQNGDVVVQQVALNGQSSLKTLYGSVQVIGTLDPQGTFTIGTYSGEVHLTLPANTALQLQANTGSGSIHNAFGSNSMGSLPQAQIIVNIGSGSIIIDKGSS